MQLRQIVFILSWILSFTSAQKDTVRLSNSGPVIKGSEIVFRAEVLDGTSHPVQDEKYFEYRWQNTVDYLMATTKGYKNTTHKSCYDWSNEAKEYNMTVNVFDLHPRRKGMFVGKAESTFTLTETLNGNLNISQELRYKNPNVSDVYSTQKPLRLHLNLTDIFNKKPSISYTWFIDGEISLVTNTPETDLPIHARGEHEIKVKAEAAEQVEGCEKLNFSEDVKGQFTEKVFLKDPVRANISGPRQIHTKDLILIYVTLNGSDPFTVCWSSNQTISMECNNRWCCQDVTNATHCNITVGRQTEGKYTFSINISNDVSRVFREHTVSVRNSPSISGHNAADILLPVIGALLVVCLLLAVTVYIMDVRKKKHVEVADFNFHPSISSSERRRSSFMTNIRYTFERMFERNSNERINRHASCDRVYRHGYGSMMETSAKEELYQSL